MKEFDLMVRSWEPEGLVGTKTVDGPVILVGKGARHDVMVGMFNDIILAIIPTITMAIPSYITDVAPDAENVIRTCPYIIRADIENIPENRGIRFRDMIGFAVGSEDWFDFDSMSLNEHASIGTLFNTNGYTIYKGMVAANRMQAIYYESDVTAFRYDNPLIGKKWVVGANGLPLVLKEDCDGSSGNNPDTVSCDDTK